LSSATVYYNYEYIKQGYDVGEEKKCRETSSAYGKTGEIKATSDEDKDVGLRDVSSRQGEAEGSGGIVATGTA